MADNELQVKITSDTAGIKSGTEEAPPLDRSNVKMARSALRIIQAEDASFTEKVTAIIPIVHAALSRNYPHLKIEDVENLIDLENVNDILDAVLSPRASIRQGIMTRDSSVLS